MENNISVEEYQTPKEMFKVIREIETRFSVDSLQLLDGTRIWNLVRVLLAYSLLRKKNGKKSLMSLLQTGFMLFKESIKPLRLPQHEIVYAGFSGTESRKMKEGFFYDIYMDPLYSILNENFYVFEWPTPSGYRREYQEKVYSKHYVPMHIPIFSRTFLDFINYKLFKKTVTIEPQKALYDIVTFFNQKTNSDRDTVMKHLTNSVTVFYIIKRFLRGILGKIQPEIIFIRCAYGRFNMALVQAARELGILTVELQHGIISQYPVGYVKEQESKNFDCIPNYLLTYGEMFTSIITRDYLFNKKNVITTGFPYLEKMKGEAPVIDQNLKKFVTYHDYNVFVTSQWTVSEQVKKFVAELSERIGPATGIIIKPHPRDESNYSSLKKYCNIYVTNKYDNTYEIFKVIDVHSTVYSTSGLEALAFGKPNIFIQAGTNIKDFFDIVDNTSSYMASSTQEFIQHLEHIKSHYNDISKEIGKKAVLFFKPNPLGNVKKFLDSMILENEDA